MPGPPSAEVTARVGAAGPREWRTRRPGDSLRPCHSLEQLGARGAGVRSPCTPRHTGLEDDFSVWDSLRPHPSLSSGNQRPDAGRNQDSYRSLNRSLRWSLRTRRALTTQRRSQGVRCSAKEGKALLLAGERERDLAHRGHELCRLGLAGGIRERPLTLPGRASPREGGRRSPPLISPLIPLLKGT